jgi:hypothetical protein
MPSIRTQSETNVQCLSACPTSAQNPGVARIAPVADLVRRRADLVERQDVMVGARVHFGIAKPPDAGRPLELKPAS